MNNGKICVSVCAETAGGLIEQMKRAEDLADVIEIRFDCLKEIEPEKLWSRIGQFRKQFNGEVLATFRPKNKGQGGNKELNLFQRKEFWFGSHVYEFVDWADFECDFEFDNDKVYARIVFNRIIWSFHAFGVIPNISNLNLIFSKLVGLTSDEHTNKDSDVLKLAIRSDDITDTIQVWKLLGRAKEENKQIIPIAMGEAGKWTRILGLAHGAFLTYAALDSGRETAPGQVSAKDLIEVYRAKELDENTEVYGIIGNPVSQSVSPYMQNAAFKFHDLNAVYIPFEVSNLDEFIEKFVSVETREVELNLKGFSVTIPHKQAILKHLDFIDEDAEKIGAVNTLKIVDGKIYGYNTDAHGFIEPLKNAYGDLSGAKVAVVGNGGAARACVYALKKENADVTIFARNPEKAESLAKDFNIKEVRSQKSEIGGFEILVNATSLGMKGKFENETPFVAEQLKDLNLVYDLVYNPFETELLKQADKANVPKLGGLAMLVAQGMKQFGIWTGKDAPMKEMNRTALKKLK
jgi:3-dehydroquinate dehydratase / shikimate dehydrogenase